MSDNPKSNEPSVAAREAAAWWSDAVRAPRYDNGDSTGMSGMLMTMLAAGKPDATQEQRASFADVLSRAIQARLDLFASWGESDYDRSVTLGVDYGPDKLLADSAREAGVNTSKFPWKTSMWVYSNHVTVSAGYGAESRLVWASDEWQASRPACGRQQWDESRTDYATYHGEPFACSLPIYHDGSHSYDEPLALCATCGRSDSWYHRKDERGHMPDFHEFAAAVSS